MTSRERLLAALNRETPDRLPASVHQWQPYHLNKYLDGMDALSAFKHFGLDAALAGLPQIEQTSPNWRKEVQHETSPSGYPLRRTLYHTPEGTLSEAWESREHTGWLVEHLIKRDEDIDLIDRYLLVPRLDRQKVVEMCDRVGDAGIVRGFVWGIQGGCWQDACELYGMTPLILKAKRDPAWVHHLLRVLQEKKLQFIEQSLADAPYDLIETGGGAASSTCISPALHREFCLPYDRAQHDALHALGHKVVYHTCGGMMPLLDLIKANGCEASETLTPPGMGGDAEPQALKEQLGAHVCLIGGMNQNDVLDHGDAATIRAEVQRLFATYGQGGGYIMSPSDHFFETPPASLQAYADAARECVY
jgi:uroporphyrinogen-III decarboxylase